MRKKYFTGSIIGFGILFLLASLILADTDSRPDSYDFNAALQKNSIYLFLYFVGFFGFYMLLRKMSYTLRSVKLYCSIFLFTCPTIKSSTVIITDTDAYHTPVLEEETQVNQGTPYNKLSIFASSSVGLLIVKSAERFHNKTIYLDRYETSYKRLEALKHSNTYQLHFFSVCINLVFFVFVFIVLKKGISFNEMSKEAHDTVEGD
jgi:hypothetical protein